jgi:hypothetical protein
MPGKPASIPDLQAVGEGSTTLVKCRRNQKEEVTTEIS